MYNGAVKLDQFAHHYIIPLMSIYAGNIYSTIWACMYIGRFRIKNQTKYIKNKRSIFWLSKIIKEVKKFLINFKFFHHCIIIIFILCSSWILDYRNIYQIGEKEQRKRRKKRSINSSIMLSRNFVFWMSWYWRLGREERMWYFSHGNVFSVNLPSGKCKKNDTIQ